MKLPKQKIHFYNNEDKNPRSQLGLCQNYQFIHDIKKFFEEVGVRLYHFFISFLRL